MKKLIVGLLPVMALMFTIVSAWVIKVEDATEKTSSCISSQSEDRYYYIAHDNYTVFPDDTFGNTVDSLISKGPDTSVQIRRNWILSDCNDWWRISTVVSASDSDGALVIANDDGCILNKPSYTKINNPTAIDAQIHYTIWYRKVFEWWANTLTSRLYHRNQGVNVWTCYPGWNTEADSDNCPKVSVKYGDQNYHKWECLNYRVFRCGDGLINRPDWTKNYNNWTYNEECDPNHPDWKNRTDWQSCNPNTCKIEYEAPVCSSNYNNKKVYTNNSTPYLKGLDSENLCNLWKLTQNTFRQIWTPIQYTWWCTNGTQSTSSNECKFKQYRCGDGEVNWWWDWSSFINGAHYEQCDPEASEWKNRTDWQKCNSSCNIEYTASCGRLDRDDAKYNSNYPSQRITENSAWLCDMWQVKAWSFKYDKETWKYTWDCVNGNSTDKCEAQDLWCGDWEKNGTEQCDYKDTDKKEWWGWKRETCNDKCVRESIPQEGPVCDSSFSGHTEYTTYSSDWLNRNSWLCTRWQVTYFNSEWSTWSQRKFTWKCNNDDLDITCTAKQEWCGDGEKNWGEVCDPNDTVNKKWWWDAWCSSTCDKAIYDSGVCGSKYKEKKTYLDISKDWITDTTPGLCDKWDVTNFYKHSSSHVYTWQCDNHWNISDTCRADQEWCGDGVKNGWEQCDYKDQYEVNWWNDWCSTSCEKKIQPDNWECNDTFYYTLRYGWKYTFYDKFIPWGTRYLYDFSVKFDEKKPYDFNQWENPTFSWMEDLGDGVYKVVSTTRRVIKSQPQYEIKTHPNFGDSSYDDIYIEYTIKYSDKAYSPKPDDSMLKTHKECAYYKISRCGDGKIDTDWEGKREQDKAEECDPGSEETKVLPDGRICNADCTISDVPAPICNSQYSGQIVDNLTENDNLCSEWTYVPGSLHFDEATNTWTWECDNVAWVGKECSATKKAAPKWRPEIEKTLKNKVIVNAIGQKLTWRVRVIAKWWDVTDFKVQDKLPKVLKYETYRIIKNEDNLKVSDKPSGPVESWSYNIYTWDVKWKLHEGHKLVIEIDSTVIKMPTKKDDYLNIACVEDDGKVDCDKANPWTAEIVKELQDKKEVRYTWQELDWKVTVTAKWWDIEDFDIWDKMPVELKYEGWELDKKNTQNWIIVTYDESRSPKLSWDVNIHYWDVKWVLYSGNKITMIVKSTVKRMPMSWEDILNIACVVQDGTEIDCDHDNPPKWDWKLTIDKTLVWKQTVENTGDILEWEIKVTASWWAVTWWFKISDIVPYVLEFTWVYSVKYNPAGLKMWKWYKWDMSELRTWKWETLTGEVWTLDVSWDMEKDQSLILRVTTKVIKMPKNDKEYRNVACVIKDWKVDCDGDEPEMKPNVKIEKHILNKDWKEVDSITWNVNDKITYIIRFENNGDVDLFVMLKDYLPKSVDFLSGELIVWKTTYKWETSTWNFATVYNWEKIQVDGITINKYTKVYLKAWEGWVLTVVGQIKEPKDEKESRTNFACIFDDDGNEIACDDAHHNIEPKGMKCEKLDIPSWNIPNGGWSKDNIKCIASGGVADLIVIDCWEGASWNRYITWSNTSLLTGKCNYPSWEKTYNLKCTVKKDSKDYNSENCKWSVTVEWPWGWWTPPIVTPPGGGGDPDPLSCKSMDYDSVSGIAKCTPSEKAYIKIDCGNEKIYTSKEKEPNAKYDCGPAATPKCYVSDDKKEWVSSHKCWDVWCFNINAWNFSIEEWEILPFYWNMNNMDEKYKQKENYIEINDDYGKAIEKYDNPGSYSCDKEDRWKIAKDSMVCVFNIYDGDVYHKGERNGDKYYEKPLYTITWPCLASSPAIKKKPLIESWYDTMICTYCDCDETNCDFHYNEKENDKLFPTAVYYIEKFWWDAQVPYTIEWWDRELKWNLQGKTDKALWEYKLELSEVRYLECNENGEFEQGKNTNACQSNFVLTNSYTVQKTPSWNLTASTDELRKYRDYNRANNRAYTFDKFINAIKTTDYKANQHVESAMKTFIDKYSKLAVNVDVWANSFLNGANVRKVPWKSIYFVDGDITIKWWTVKKPFTIVQTKGKTTINWNVQNNMMLLTLWDIEFKWTNCQNDQIVQWIFYAKGSLQRDQRYRNDKIDGTWCTNWWLHVKWVLIWNNFNTLMDWSRSNLNNWFKVNWSEQDISNQRKNMIMNWASVVIEYSPSIFTKSTMPPGAEDFTTALDIYKK